MKIVPTEVSYQPLRNPDHPDHPVEGMEVHFLFLTQPGKSYSLRSTTDGVTFKDEGKITLPPNTKLVVTTNPKETGIAWMQLLE